MSGDPIARAALDTFPINVAVVDGEGEIVLTNRAWREFEDDAREADDDVGTDYIAAADADGEDAAAAVAGIRAVLAGERDEFRLEYPCHSPDQRRWFLMRVSPVDVDGERGAVVAHVDVTDRKEAELAAAERADELARLLDRVDGLVREVTAAVVEARSRPALEAGLCEAVVGADPYTFAWVGRPDLRAESLAPRGWAGDGPDDVADRTLSLSADAPAAVAHRTGDLQVAAGDPPDDAAGSRDGSTGDREEVAADGASAAGPGGWAPVPCGRAVAAVPLTYRATTYGVLSVYADDPDAFDERERTVLAAMGEVAATGIHAVTSGRVLQRRSVVEMEVELSVPGTYLAALAGESDTVRHHDAFVDDDGAVRTVLTVEGADAATVRERAAECSAVASAVVLADHDDGTLVELSVESSLVAAIADFDGVTTALSATGDAASATAWFPDEAAARAAFDHLDDRYGGVELVGFRERERSPDSADGFRADVESSLTDRQLTALRMAYHSGYFEWPRDVSGEEVAEAMDITRATFHQHLREAQRKLAAALLEPGPT